MKEANAFNLEEYLSNGVENIVKGIMRVSLKNPQESLFLLQYAHSSKHARSLRQQKEKEGKHIPPFLIASITNQCNLCGRMEILSRNILLVVYYLNRKIRYKKFWRENFNDNKGKNS